MLIGLVKWFDKVKGFGVVETPEGEEYFLHNTSFITVPDKILVGTPIAFLPTTDKTKNRKSGIECRLVGNPEDWKVILSYLGKSEIIQIEVEVTGQGKRGNKYHRKEIQTFSLILLSLKYFFHDKNEEEISNFIIDYYDNDLDIKNFILFCGIIENRLLTNFSKEIASNILNKVFCYFGNNLDDELLYIVWKHKKFKFISYNEKDDYEIPESILNEHINEIEKPELIRISKYSFGSDFCSHYIRTRFDKIETLTSDQITGLYQYIEFEKETEQETRKHQLDILYTQKIEIELIEKANQLGIIRNFDNFNDYNRLLLNIPNQFTEISINKLTDSIYEIITKKCSDEFKPELWIKGIINDVPFELVSKYFLNKEIQSEKRTTILTKLQTDWQFELLKKYAEEYSFEKAFVLLEELFKKENLQSYYFNFFDVHSNIDFWKNKKGKELFEAFTNYVNDNCADEEKFKLFIIGYLKDVPLNIVRQITHQLEKEKCIKIFRRVFENKLFIKEILVEKVTLDNINSLGWLYDLASEFLDQINFNSFDEKVFERIKQSEYFKFWEIGKAKIFPQNQIEIILQEKYEDYTQITKWIENNATTSEIISDFLFTYLYKQVIVTDRMIFHKQLNHIKFLLLLNELHLEQIKQIQNDFYNIILWLLDKEEILDFELLKQKFIYFNPDEQIRIIRKLFFLKANGKFDLTIKKLNELSRFDLDLYQSNLELNGEMPIDISTEIIIYALLSFEKNNRFIVESELLTVVLNDLLFDKTKRFKLDDYFEDCLGRQTAEFDWSTEGQIKKIFFGENQFYFAISFPTGKTRWVNNRYGGSEKYTPNPNFEIIKDTVKRISGVKWNSNEKHWGVPSQYETEILNFAKEQRFFVDFEGSNYSNNTHLAVFKREDKPSGILFCEGRLANKPHELFKQNFWWCGGQSCFSKCETIHTTEDWENYTLLDFCEILGLNTDEINKMGDFIPKGHYYQFISLINRFNRLLDKLYCNDCGHILYPSDFGTGHFAANTVVRFQCRNDKCDNNEEIYLNHCLNGQCNNIVDSRISKKCNNGLYICDNCGSCCSHNMLERRLSNLNLNGGKIHNNLIKCVNEKLGHLERAEYFCYNCNSGMKEISNDIFQCSVCNVKYDTIKYKFKRPHKNLRIVNSIGNIRNSEEGFDDNFYNPF